MTQAKPKIVGELDPAATGHSDGYSSSAATNESRPDSFGTRSDARSNITSGETEEAKAEARQQEEEDNNNVIRSFIADLRPPKTETNLAGGYTADNLLDLFTLLGLPTNADDIKAALPQTENPLLTDAEVLATVHAIRTAQHVEVPRVLASIEGCIARLNPPRYALYRLGCLGRDHPLVAKAALVKLDWNVQPKHRLFMSIAAVLVVVGTVMVVVIALLWVNSTYSHVTSQLRDVQRITQLSAVHLQTSDFNALGSYLRGQTESIASLLAVRDNATETIARTRASDDVLLLSTMINRSSVMHLFAPMAAAMHGLKAILSDNGANDNLGSTAAVVANENISSILDGWSAVKGLAEYRRFIMEIPTPAALRGPTPPAVGSVSTLSDSTFDVADGGANITLVYDSERDVLRNCLTSNATRGNACDGGPLFFRNRFVGPWDPSSPSSSIYAGAANVNGFARLSELIPNATVFEASSPAAGDRASVPANETDFFGALMNASHYFSTGGEATVRLMRTITGGGNKYFKSGEFSPVPSNTEGNGIVGYDVLADGTVPALPNGGADEAAAFIEDATGLYMSLYIPLRGIAIVVAMDQAAMIGLRVTEVAEMSSKLNGYETGATMTTRRGSLVAHVDAVSETLTYVTPLTRLIHSCYTSNPPTCTAQDDLTRRAWAERRPLLDTVISYTGSPMVVAVAPAAYDMVAVINIPVTVVLEEARAALSDIVARHKALMLNGSDAAATEVMLVERDAKTGVIRPQVPTIFQHAAGCNVTAGGTAASAAAVAAILQNADGSACRRGPTSSFAAELAMTTQQSGWVVQQDYQLEPVLAGYAYLPQLDMGVVIEQSAVAIQQKSLAVIIGILNSQNSKSDSGDETAVVHFEGTPPCETFDRFADCSKAEFCYSHPTDPARYGVVYRSDCRNCRPLPVPTPSVVAYLTKTSCVLGVDPSCSLALDQVARLPLMYRNAEPQDVEANDYRGKKVIAVYSYVPSFSVGIILKVDSKRVQAPIMTNVGIAVAIAAVIIIIGLVALILFSRTVLNRIEQEWLRYKVLIDGEKEKYNNLIKTIVPPRIRRDLEILGRSSLTIPNVALSFVDVINFTDSVREWHVDVIAKFVTYYQYTVRALLNQYQIDRVRFVGDAVFSAAGLSAAETNRGRRNRRGIAGAKNSNGTSSQQTGTSGGGEQQQQHLPITAQSGSPNNNNNKGGGGRRRMIGGGGGVDDNNSDARSDGGGGRAGGGSHRLSQGNVSRDNAMAASTRPGANQNNQHGGQHSPSANNRGGTNSNANSSSAANRSASQQSSDSDGIGGGDGGSASNNLAAFTAALSQEQRRMGRRPPIYRQACYAAALLETFGPRYAHYPEEVPDVEEMFAAVTETHGPVFPNVIASARAGGGNPEEVGSVLMPAMRIGIHCGPATFSMLEIGNTPSFDMFGPSVALAKRMEATCAPNRIHLTEAAKELLEMADTEMAFSFDAARKTAVKGIGTINSYLVASADIVIPDELLKTMHVQHAVRRVYHEEFAYANNPSGANNNNNNGGGGGGGNGLQSHSSNQHHIAVMGLGSGGNSKGVSYANDNDGDIDD